MRERERDREHNNKVKVAAAMAVHECREYCQAPSCMQRNVYSGIKGIDIVKIVEWTELWCKKVKQK